MESDRDISLTFLKGMAVLKAFDEDQTHMTIADIARATDLDPATARRLVLTLVRLGYVRKDSRTFSLTPRILVLAGGFLRGNQFGKFIQPLLNNCASETGLAVSLSMVDDVDALLVAQSTLRSTQITYGFTVGSRLPLMHTAIGRMLLAYGPEDWASANLETAPINPLTPESLLDRDAIKKAVDDVGQRGFAVVSNEFEIDVTGIAVPVGRKGAIKAALGVSNATTELSDPSRVTQIVSALRRSASDLTRANIF
ncbi:IclR family transcriptional regulator domain-containing protein [Tianweitania sediminis]|uniref:Helix-turn-helix domain-containing protein n=1 Tax=Tianweitania sediminis TaxID=1502156 RepID=A0A8J7RHU3_9HYPH|nr:IclR family transcriptional regulator C-terminal domain-containing protein [Tianweitania sediminis]MBP0438701.1 helix-turn-helix domain-containing protein [Tianweitania sediminis]